MLDQLRHRRVLACTVLAAAALGSFVVLTRDAPTADAEAVVIAQVSTGTPDVDLAPLSRYGEAVFEDGAVAGAVGHQLGHEAGDYDQIIPRHVSLIPPDDGIAFIVVGHSHDPQTAVDLANGAADAFVARINASGTEIAGMDVGRFSVMQYAETATTAEEGVVLRLALLALAAALALAGLLLLRRPAPALT